ncbi:MAG: PAS domain S-box protein [Gemmatimonadaceae bacterium]|nr:PAS domain S-box protein [Gemmatimonadaceae bacterium]
MARAFDHVDGFGVVMLALDGTVLSWNRGAERLFGYAPEQMIGQSIARLYAADDVSADPVPERLRRAAESADTVTYQGWRIRADGTRLWSEGDLSALRDAQGVVVGFIKTLHDRSELYARDQERALAAVVAAQGHVGVVIADVAMRIEWVNGAFEQLSGFTLEALLGRSPDVLYGAETDATTVAALERTIRAGDVFTGELCCERPGGETYVVELIIVPTRHASGRVERFVGFGIDVTRQKQTQHQLAVARERVTVAEQQLHSVVEAMADGLLFIVSPARVEAANRAALSLLGFESLESLQRAAPAGLPFWSAADRPVALADQPQVRALATGEPVMGETYRVTDGGGTRRWLRVQAVPLAQGDAGAGVVLSLADVTEAQHVADAMRAARDAAHAANRTKSDFLARMSHELRTPLNSIIGFSRVLQRKGAHALDDTARDHVSRIERNGTHLLALINDVLDLSHVESGRLRVEWEPCDVPRFLADTLAELDGQPRAAHVALRLHAPATVRPLMTDAHRLRQVLVNLLANAFKFTERGAVDVRICTDAQDDVAAIEVADTGIGIPANRLEAIFESFEQADVSHSRRFGGTGLGLSISRKLCLLLGARLEVESTLGQGSTFRIVFDRAVVRRAA